MRLRSQRGSDGRDRPQEGCAGGGGEDCPHASGTDGEACPLEHATGSGGGDTGCSSASPPWQEPRSRQRVAPQPAQVQQAQQAKQQRALVGDQRFHEAQMQTQPAQAWAQTHDQREQQAQDQHARQAHAQPQPQQPPCGSGLAAAAVLPGEADAAVEPRADVQRSAHVQDTRVSGREFGDAHGVVVGLCATPRSRSRYASELAGVRRSGDARGAVVGVPVVSQPSVAACLALRATTAARLLGMLGRVSVPQQPPGSWACWDALACHNSRPVVGAVGTRLHATPAASACGCCGAFACDTSRPVWLGLLGRVCVRHQPPGGWGCWGAFACDTSRPVVAAVGARLRATPAARRWSFTRLRLHAPLTPARDLGCPRYIETHKEAIGSSGRLDIPAALAARTIDALDHVGLAGDQVWGSRSTRCGARGRPGMGLAGDQAWGSRAARCGARGQPDVGLASNQVLGSRATRCGPSPTLLCSSWCYCSSC
eukprot:358031-Chlamydomonas_euryale.AAC.9